MFFSHNSSWFSREVADNAQSSKEPSFQQLDNDNPNRQSVEEGMGKEYLLPDGTPIYKFYKRNPYGG